MYSSGRLSFCRLACSTLAFLLLIHLSSSATTVVVRNIQGAPRFTEKGVTKPIRTGDELRSESVIRTGLHERVDLVVGEQGRLVSLMSESELRIDSQDHSLYLAHGELVGSVRTSREQDRSPIYVGSSLGLTKIDSGDFSINTLDQEVSVLSGKGITHNPASSRQKLDPIAIPAGHTVSTENRIVGLNPKTSAALLGNIDKLVSGDTSLRKTVKAAANVQIASPEPVPGAGAGTPGYWGNHPEAWPVDSIVIGGITYTKAAAINGIKNAPKNDYSYIIFQLLVAAELDVLIGCDSSCIWSDLNTADNWLHDHPIGSNPSTATWNQIQPISEKLDKYDNGKLCAPARQ